MNGITFVIIYRPQLMNRYLTFGAALFVLLSSCNKLNSNSVEFNDQAVALTFTHDEVEAVGDVVHFMDSTLLAACNCQNVEEAYTQFFSNPTFSEPSFNEFALERLIKQMKKSGLFSEFWSITSINAPDSLKGVYLDFNMNGKLFKLIESVGQEDEAIGEYYGYLMRDKEISQALIAMFPYDFANLNYKRSSVRLILATHFIYLSESKKYSTKKVKLVRIEDEEHADM